MAQQSAQINELQGALRMMMGQFQQGPMPPQVMHSMQMSQQQPQHQIIPQQNIPGNVPAISLVGEEDPVIDLLSEGSDLE